MTAPERAREGLRVLDLPLAADSQWSPAPGHPGTVADYLLELFEQFWTNDADPKYGMVGSDDWRHDLYVPLRDAGLIPTWEDGYTPETTDRREAERLITAAIRALPYLRAGNG